MPCLKTLEVFFVSSPFFPTLASDIINPIKIFNGTFHALLSDNAPTIDSAIQGRNS
jgi:hypothetical protein